MGRFSGATPFGVRLKARCCVPGTARILKGALSLPFVLKLIKSQTQPDGEKGSAGRPFVNK